jgi:hypothetical protein
MNPSFALGALAVNLSRYLTSDETLYPRFCLVENPAREILSTGFVHYRLKSASEESLHDSLYSSKAHHST